MYLSTMQQAAKGIIAPLASLTNAELDEIMGNDEKIEELLNGADQSYLRTIEAQKNQTITSNEELSEANLNREPELSEGREKIVQLSEEGEQLTKLVEDKVKQIREKTGDMSLETALALLQTAASEMEEESDAIAKKFMDEGGELDEFLEKFLERRKIMHTRLVKAEKMAKILSRDPTLSNIPSYVNAPPVNINSHYFPGVPIPSPRQPPSVPYPTGNFNMPMPSYYQNNY